MFIEKHLLYRKDVLEQKVKKVAEECGLKKTVAYKVSSVLGFISFHDSRGRK